MNRGNSNICVDLDKIFTNSGAYEVLDILKIGNSINQFEKSILKAIHWFSLSEQQIEKQNKVLMLITCLETFLTQETGYPIRLTVAEGTAMIIRDNLDDRKKLKKRINYFYKQRSSLSHGGSSNKILNSEIKELKGYVFSFIKTMIERRIEFKTCNELMDWLEDQRLDNNHKK